MAGIEPIRFVKNWNLNTRTREENWDEIANKISQFGTRTNNNFIQLGLDIGGTTYSYNGVGAKTQATPVLDRLDTLEATINTLGTRNIGLDLSDTTKIKVVGADGTNLSSTNKGIVTFNESSDAGDLVTREITANTEVTLTGCHWGYDTLGDLTDVVLWVLFIDDGTNAVLGVAAQGGRETITAANAETVQSNVDSLSKVLTESTISSTYNVTYLGWVKADFDDTGNPGGENYWTVQGSAGDVNIQPVQTYLEGTIVF